MLTLQFAATVILAVLLLLVSYVDIFEHRIPNALNFALLVAGLVFPVLLGLHQWTWGLASVCVGFSVFWIVRWLYSEVRQRHGLGLGDVKFFGAAGGWIGMEALPSMLLAASLSALAFAGAAVLFGRSMSHDMKLPFGPFLALGLMAVWLHGPIAV